MYLASTMQPVQTLSLDRLAHVHPRRRVDDASPPASLLLRKHTCFWSVFSDHTGDIGTETARMQALGRQEWSPPIDLRDSCTFEW
jgi:hypothetical protein